MAESHFIAITIVWLIIITIILWNIMSFRKKLRKTVIGKGVTLEDSTTHRFKYNLEPIFSNPKNGFDLENTSINLEIITDKTVRVAKLPITSDCMQIYYDLCLVRDIRAYFVIIRNKKPLPSITKVRGIHDCQTQDSKIFLEGIGVKDLKTNETKYYSIQEFIYNEDIQSTAIHKVKEQEIRCCSKQTLTPSFIPLSIEDFGRSLKYNTNAEGGQSPSDGQQSNVVLLSPKLHWFESIIFLSLFLNSTFFLTVAILVYLKSSLDTNNAIVVSILLSGFLSLLITEILTIIFRHYIRYYYNSSCAPIKVESGTDSMIWRLIRCFYLFLILLLSVLSSLSIPLVIESRNNIKNQTLSEEYEFKLINDRMINEILFLLIFLSASLLITVTIWIILFGIIRYLCRYRPSKQLKDDLESGTKDSDQKSKKSIESIDPKVVSPKSLAKKSESDSKKPKSVLEKSIRTENSLKNQKKEKSKFDSSKSGRLSFETEFLEKEISDEKRRNRLATNSVIVKPTKSVGFINPEQFRLSESTIDYKEKSKSKTKRS